MLAAATAAPPINAPELVAAGHARGGSSDSTRGVYSIRGAVNPRP